MTAGKKILDTIRARKRQHLDLCLKTNPRVESGDSRLAEIAFPHRSLVEGEAKNLSLKTEFLGYQLNMPLMISCMTGGSKKGWRLNTVLARAAAERRIAIGTGSIRVMLRYPETRSHFQLKNLAADSPVLANIGAAELSTYPASTLLEAVKSLDADGLYIHLNPAQEMFQKDGGQILPPWYDQLRRLLDKAPFPILVKETGAGIPPLEGLRLLRDGVAFIDIAGSGGTDWVAIEAWRLKKSRRQVAEAFRHWGYPTAELLIAYRKMIQMGGKTSTLLGNRVIASGGLRSPRDFALALGCGAWLAAAALPFIRMAYKKGLEGTVAYIDSLAEGIRAAIILSGAHSLENLRHSPLRIHQALDFAAQELVNEALLIQTDPQNKQGQRKP